MRERNKPVEQAQGLPLPQARTNTTGQQLPPVAVVKLVVSLINLLGNLRRKVTPAPLALLEMMATYYFTSNAIMVAGRLGIADLLKDGPKSSEELAQAIGADSLSLYRLLRALTNVGVFAQRKDGRFQVTSIGKYLQSATPGSLHALTVKCSDPWHYHVWSELYTKVKTGRDPSELLFGMNLFQYFEQHAEAGAHFNQAMLGFTAQSTAALAATYDFSRIGTLVDVGGGLGTVVATLLKHYPQMRAVLFDRPHVIAGARNFLVAEGVAERCELVSGDFFETVPGGSDVYLLQHIIHDWDDERASAILKSCRRAMGANATLLLSEMVIPPDNRPYFGTVFDLEMQVSSARGRERSEAEFRALFAEAGFKLTRIIPTPSFSFVIEGIPV